MVVSPTPTNDTTQVLETTEISSQLENTDNESQVISEEISNLENNLENLSEINETGISKIEEDIKEEENDIKEKDIKENTINIVEATPNVGLLEETTEIEKVEENNNSEIENISLEEILPTTHSLDLKPGIESGLQIQFTSLKLNEFPILDSNLSSHAKSIESINLNTTNLTIGDEVIYNVDIKIHSYQKFKMLELKTREFKLALSISLSEDNVLEADNNGYFSYEIFSKIKNSRLFNIIKVFQKVFSGDTISFTINDLKASVSCDNRLQYHKFIIMENALNIYIDIGKKLHLNKAKNFSEAQLPFYTLHLLDEFLKGKTTINSWINFNINNDDNIKEGDFINFVKIHEINIRGINFNLKETIHLKSPITASEITKDKITCYKKTVQINLEKIMK